MLQDIFAIHRAGRLDEAEQGYRDWLTEHPDDADALHLLAALRRERGDLAGAIELARRAVELAPERANFQSTLAGFMLHARQFDEARAGFTNALRLNPNAMGAALGIAQVAALQGDLAAASAALTKAERIAPDHPQVLSQRAGLAQARGDHALAVKLSMEAIKRNPNDPAIQLRVARSFAAQGQMTFAEQAYRNAIQLKPSLLSARIALAQMLLASGRPRDALAEFQAVLSQQANHPLALAGRGDIRRHAGDMAGAIADYRQALDGGPGIAQIVVALAQSLDITGETEAAHSVLADALSRQPAHPDLRRQSVTFAARQGAESYIAACKAWLEAAPDHHEARERLASTLELMARYDEADALAHDALAHDSRASFARLILARSALREGRAADAQEQLNLVPEAALTPSGKADRAVLRGLARDGLQDHAGAAQVWLAGHASQTGLARLADPGPVDAIEATLPPCGTGNADDVTTPVFLIGLPGAGAENVAELLRRGGYTVLTDRFGRQPRSDALASGEFVALSQRIADATTVARFRERYLESLSAAGSANSAALVDWLPFMDLRMAALLQAAFPNARYVVAERDLRDCLVNWLALGSSLALAFESPDRAGAWLVKAAEHQQAAIARLGETSIRAVRPSDMQDIAGLLDRIDAFVGRAPAGERDASISQPMTGRGGLPTALPEGHWRTYAEPLKDAFAHIG